MTGKPARVFLHRPQGVDAMPIGGGVAARPYKPVRAVLQTAHGGVLVRSVVRQPDGAFTGEVYGIMPREQSVARGERVRFEESQIFTFKGDDTGEGELAEMLQVFEEGLRELEAQPVKGRAAAGRAVREADGASHAAATAHRSQPPSARMTPEPDHPSAQPAVAHAQGAQTGEELSVFEAMAILRASEQQGREPKEAPVENDFAKPAPSEQAAPRRDSPHEEPIACMECGAILPSMPPAADSAEPQIPTRITCPRCGRINDIAEAQAAGLHRQRARSGP